MRIILDAGHGKDTPGKRSPNGQFREYLFNRQITALVAGMLKDIGIPFSLVVRDDYDTPLPERANRVNEMCDTYGDCILVSIHANASGNGSDWGRATGWSCYTTKGQNESDVVAECMYDAFEQAFPDKRIRKDGSDGDRDWEENFYILRKTKCPAVLLENFFYDTKSECDWLLTEGARVRIAEAIVAGIVRYLKCRRRG